MKYYIKNKDSPPPPNILFPPSSSSLQNSWSPVFAQFLHGFVVVRGLFMHHSRCSQHFNVSQLGKIIIILIYTWELRYTKIISNLPIIQRYSFNTNQAGPTASNLPQWKVLNKGDWFPSPKTTAMVVTGKYSTIKVTIHPVKPDNLKNSPWNPISTQHL